MNESNNFLSTDKPHVDIADIEEYKLTLCNNKRSVFFWGLCFVLIYVVTLPLDTNHSTYPLRLSLHILGLLLSFGFIFSVHRLRFEYAILCALGIVIQTSLTIYFMPNDGYSTLINTGKSVLIGLTWFMLVMSALYSMVSGIMYFFTKENSERFVDVDYTNICNKVYTDITDTGARISVARVSLKYPKIQNSRNTQSSRQGSLRSRQGSLRSRKSSVQNSLRRSSLRNSLRSSKSKL